VARVATEAEPSESGSDQIEAFLIRHIRANPGLGFHAIVATTRAARGVSRATVARHLSRLVRFGDLTRGQGRTYAVSEPTAARPRPIVEVRWFDLDITIRPDGTARTTTHREIRVVSGQIDHLDFTHMTAPREFIWWCSDAARMSWIPAIRSPVRLSTHRLEFALPLKARNPAWKLIQYSEELPVWYRMASDPVKTRPGTRPPHEVAEESESIEVPGHGRSFDLRFTSDSQLGLRVVLPKGYPVTQARSRVRILTNPSAFDAEEETRMANLLEDPWHQDGLRRVGTTFTLGVPRPKVDRHYEIHWSLPSAKQRDRWRATQRPAVG